LPWVENGIITLIGATTENPSFELTRALLSRCRVFVLEPLNDDHIRTIIARGTGEWGKGKGSGSECFDAAALELLVRHAQGDARRALNTLEAIFKHAEPQSPFPSPIGADLVRGVLEKPSPVYDKAGEQHYNPIPPPHKADRDSTH